MQVAVIGLGRFGSSLARILIDEGHEVIVVDKNEALVQPFENLAEQAIIGDATDETLLRSLGVQDLDAVVVAIGDDVEASVLACISLIELGAKYVIAKAENDKHAKILKRIGVHKVIQPERDSAKVIAEHLIHPKIEERIDIGENHSIVEIKAPSSFWGKTLKELELTSRYGILVIAIKRREAILDKKGEISGYKDTIIAPPSANTTILEHDTLIILSPKDRIREIERWK